MKASLFLVITTVMLSACSTVQETQIIQTGVNNYEIVKEAPSYPGSGVLQKEITDEAMGFCRSLNKRLHIIAVHETKPPFTGSKTPLAEIKFECTDKKN